MKKIGIFSGTFDPIHAGHITSALKAVELAGLDRMYFIPEAIPRRKDGVTHYAHRVAMLRLALKPYKQLKLLELPDRQFSVQKTLPRLKKLFPKDELYMLLGSDMVDLLISPKAAEQWPRLDTFLSTVKIIEVVRGRRIKEEDRQRIDMLQSDALIFASHKPQTSSKEIRDTLLAGKKHRDVLPSISAYIKDNWLYAAVPET